MTPVHSRCELNKLRFQLVPWWHKYEILVTFVRMTTVGR